MQLHECVWMHHAWTYVYVNAMRILKGMEISNMHAEYMIMHMKCIWYVHAWHMHHGGRITHEWDVNDAKNECEIHSNAGGMHGNMLVVEKCICMKCNSLREHDANRQKEMHVQWTMVCMWCIWRLQHECIMRWGMHEKWHQCTWNETFYAGMMMNAWWCKNLCIKDASMHEMQEPMPIWCVYEDMGRWNVMQDIMTCMHKMQERCMENVSMNQYQGIK